MQIDTRHGSVSFLERLAFGTGECGASIGYQLITFYLTYFYTDVFGLSPAQTALLFLTVRLYAAAVLPVFGYLVDRTHTRWGRFRPYLLCGAIPNAVFLVLCFTSPPFQPVMKLVWAWVTNVALATIACLLITPYSSLPAVMTQDPHERTVLSTFRAFIGFGAGGCAIVLLKPIVDLFPSERLGYPMAMVVFGALIVFGYFFTFAVVKERVALPEKTTYRATAFLGLFIQNRHAVLLTVAWFLVICVTAYKNAATIYYFKYYLSREALLPLFLFLTGAPILVGTSMTPTLNKRYGKRNSSVAGMALVVVCNVWLFFMTPSDVALLIVVSALAGMCGVVPLVTMNSMIADTVDYGEWVTGRRTEGIIFSVYHASAALAFALSGSFFGVSLSIIGYVANQANSETAVLGLRVMFTLVPAFLWSLCIIPLWKYNLTYERIRVLVKEMHERGSVQENV